MDEAYGHWLQPVEALFDFSVDWVIVTNGIPGVFNFRAVVDAINQSFIIAVHMNGASPAIYQWVIVGILEKKLRTV